MYTRNRQRQSGNRAQETRARTQPDEGKTHQNLLLLLLTSNFRLKTPPFNPFPPSPTRPHPSLSLYHTRNPPNYPRQIIYSLLLCTIAPLAVAKERVLRTDDHTNKTEAALTQKRGETLVYKYHQGGWVSIYVQPHVVVAGPKTRSRCGPCLLGGDGLLRTQTHLPPRPALDTSTHPTPLEPKPKPRAIVDRTRGIFPPPTKRTQPYRSLPRKQGGKVEGGNLERFSYVQKPRAFDGPRTT